MNLSRAKIRPALPHEVPDMSEDTSRNLDIEIAGDEPNGYIIEMGEFLNRKGTPFTPEVGDVEVTDPTDATRTMYIGNNQFFMFTNDATDSGTTGSVKVSIDPSKDTDDAFFNYTFVSDLPGAVNLAHGSIRPATAEEVPPA